MPDITSVLERAAATPAGPPDLDGPLRRRRWTRVSVVASACVVAVVFSILFVTRRDDHRRVIVETPPPTVPAAPTKITSNGATIDLLPGWYATPEPLDWWTHSPYELFSIANVPLPPSPHKDPNEAACPSEIARVAVDNLPADGAYLWIGLWRPAEGLYSTDPRPASSDAMMLEPGCKLPRGETALLANLRDGSHDYPVTIVLGPDAPPSRRADIDQMLDSLDLSGAAPTRP